LNYLEPLLQEEARVTEAEDSTGCSVAEGYLEFYFSSANLATVTRLHLMQQRLFQEALIFALFSVFCWTCVLYVSLYRLIDVSSQGLPWKLPPPPPSICFSGPPYCLSVCLIIDNSRWNSDDGSVGIVAVTTLWPGSRPVTGLTGP
jgi:hypothetical protein